MSKAIRDTGDMMKELGEIKESTVVFKISEWEKVYFKIRELESKLSQIYKIVKNCE